MPAASMTAAAAAKTERNGCTAIVESVTTADNAQVIGQLPGSGAHFGARASGLAERAAASVNARSPLIAVSGGGWPLRSVAISSRYGPMRYTVSPAFN